MKKVIILIVAIATVLFIALGTSKAASASAEEEIGNVCWLTGQDGAFLPEGEWELTPTESVGTHSISGMWCGPIGESVTPEVVIPPVEQQPLSPEAVAQGDTFVETPTMTELPATGEVTDILVLAAAIVLAAGVFAYITTKFNRS